MKTMKTLMAILIVSSVFLIGGGAYYAYENSTKVTFADGPTMDAFSRLRVSTPTTIFDCKLTYDLQTLVYDTVIDGTGASIAYDSVNRAAEFSLENADSGAVTYMQSFEYIPYQPSKSQLIMMTYNMREHVPGVLKFAGYGDDHNGIFIRSNGTGFEVCILSDTECGDQIIPQNSWNIDKLNGSGGFANPTGKILDVSKAQILVIDFQALFVGRVRIGFNIDGHIIYVHEFNNANNCATPYIQTANLPIKCGMQSLANDVSTDMMFMCSAVSSEGGRDKTFGLAFAKSDTVTALNGASTHLLSIRPKLTFRNLTNRTIIGFISLDLLVTGNTPVKWQLVLGQNLTDTVWSDVNTAYSATEFSTTGTVSGSPTIVIDEGYVGATAQSKSAASMALTHCYPITLDAAGKHRDLGTLTLLVSGVDANSACHGTITFEEYR